MFLQSLVLLAAALLGVQAGSRPFPFDACTTHDAGQSNVLFCDGPNSIPHRYIVKFKPDVTENQVLSHLEAINGTLPGSDCSLGEWSPSFTNSTLDLLGRPRPDDGPVICTRCGFGEFNWQSTDRSQPAKCGFTYIYDSEINGTSFTAYSAAISGATLSKVLADPIVQSLSSKLIIRLKLSQLTGFCLQLLKLFLLLLVPIDPTQ
jgi:prepilin-type processing-associated H-X9-DG protein